jgi:hypothetical protein
MKRALIYSFLILITLFGENVFAQSIKGKVVDAVNSDVLVGAVIKIAGTTNGAVTDIDGTYSVDDVKPGMYEVRVSFIGYTDKIFKNVELKPNETLRLDVVLQVDGLKTAEIVVETTVTLANEQAMLVEQKNSDKVQDGISEQQIKRAPDAAASDVLKRVTGVSIVNDKYVFVRGTSERYNNTTLNGVLLPSTDPDKKSFSFDLFPANLLESVIISKTFTPDQIATYSGGLVQINTKDFPDDLTMNLNLNSGFNDNTSTKSFSTYDASNKELLGFINLGIDNSRKLPSIIPDQQVKNSTFSRDEITSFSRSFTNNWGQNTTKAPMNSGFQLSAGNSFNVGKVPVGFFAAYSYKSGFSNEQIERNDYNTDFSKLISYNGSNSEASVLWGGLLNLNVKLGNNGKIGLKSSYTLSSDDETEFYSGFVNGISGSDAFDRKLYITKFTERNLLSAQLFGDQNLSKLGNLLVEWKLSYSESSRKEPDMKTMIYQRDLNSQDIFTAAINPNFGNTYAGGRFFSDLKDINRSLGLNFELPVKFRLPLINNEVSNSKIKFGALLNGTSRNFSARNFGVGYYIGMPFDILAQPIETIFNPNNFDNSKLFYDELTNETDKYNATDNTYSGYAIMDIPVNRFRFIIGARLESNEQKVNTLGIIGNPVNNSLKNNDILPSINIVYRLGEFSNIRAAYTQTISRPELREIAPFSYVDFVSSTLVYGNSVDLHRTLVRNYDIRYEIFPKAGEIVSVSLFYKYIDAPIEEVFIPTSTNRIKSFQNAMNGANNYGVEFEIRKNLGFISKLFNDLSLNGNLTLVNSNINLEGVTTTATTKDRRMQGQSPYMVNLGLFYDNYKFGTSVNLVYNRFGNRISEVGVNGYENIQEAGRDLLDLSISKKVTNRLELKFAIRDILNQDQKFIQEVSGKELTVKNYKSGTNYLLTFSYKY